jgi:hypothetical protein
MAQIQRLEGEGHTKNPRYVPETPFVRDDHGTIRYAGRVDMEGLRSLINEVVAKMDESGTRPYIYRPSPLPGQSDAFTIEDGEYVFADPAYAQRVKRVEVAWDERPVQFRKGYLIGQEDEDGNPILDANGDQVKELVYGIKLDVRPRSYDEQADLLVGAFPIKLGAWATPNGKRIILQLLKDMGGREGRARKSRVDRLLEGAAEYREHMQAAKENDAVRSLLDRAFGED